MSESFHDNDDFPEDDLLLDNDLSQPDDLNDLSIEELLESLGTTTVQKESLQQLEDRDQSSQTLRTRLAGPSSNKAGMESIDKDKVNQIIYEASKGSAFFENERKKDQALTERIDAMMAKYERIRHLNLRHEEQVVDNMIHDLDKERDLTQSICHVDMDAFYASVEELENPELKDVPMAVGDMAMLCTSNYKARTFGVRSAMPGFIGIKLCPQLKIIPLHFDKYRAASSKVRAIFMKYDPNFAPMSLDEAYLNLTNYMTEHNMTAPAVVQQIRDEIFQDTQLTASAGVAANKMLAKICSDMNKPNGQYDLANDRDAIRNFIQKMRIRKVPGIGRVTERVLASLGVETCGDVYERRAVLYRLLSPVSFKSILRAHLGLGSTTVQASTSQKSISVERTFSAISGQKALFAKVDELASLLEKDLEKKRYKGKTVGIKIKLTSFELRVRAKTLPYSVHKAADIAKVAKELIAKEMPMSLRLMGVRLSSLETTSDESVTKFFPRVDKSLTPEKRPAIDDDPEDETSKKQKEEEEKEEVDTMDAACPICNRHLHLDNTAFNQHVDECLSRMEVRSILHAESQVRHPVREKGGGKSLLDYYSRPSS
ncbi:hypothetical protein BJV82DRAFT_548937 [Fennellomyces sp. T-0311]|nr:hypothetical protein BJV82DRAFT_548937 [Fennellomyces sp. T-0311]